MNYVDYMHIIQLTMAICHVYVIHVILNLGVTEEDPIIKEEVHFLSPGTSNLKLQVKALEVTTL